MARALSSGKERVEPLSSSGYTTDLCDGIEAVEWSPGVSLARVPPSLPCAEHRVGNFPVELAVVECALRVLPDAHIDLLHVAGGGSSEVDGAPA